MCDWPIPLTPQTNNRALRACCPKLVSVRTRELSLTELTELSISIDATFAQRSLLLGLETDMKIIQDVIYRYQVEIWIAAV